MNWYPWLNGPYRQLLVQHQEGRGHHALLLHAIDGMGEASLVYALARWLLCQRPQGEKSCGECHACRLMMAGTHPDWHVLQPEKGKSTLGIEPVRQVIEQLQSHAQQGGAKLVWIARCEQLSEAAANALLKTLEEPPAQTYFLLGTREPAQLLPTLRSRCFYLYLAPPAEDASLRWLAQQMQGDGQWLTLLGALNHEDGTERLGWLCALLLDALKLCHGAAASVANCDRLPLIQRLAVGLGEADLRRLLQAWIACRHQLLATPGVNRELMLMRQLCAWDAPAPAHP